MKTCVPTEIRSLERSIASLAFICKAEVSTIFDDFLTYVIYGFSPGEKSLENWKFGKEETVMFYQMYAEWVQIMNVQVDALGWYDVWGSCICLVWPGIHENEATGSFLLRHIYVI